MGRYDYNEDSPREPDFESIVESQQYHQNGWRIERDEKHGEDARHVEEG